MTDSAVLGVHVGLNSAAALVSSDGQLAWAEQEERHSRNKNHCGFPEKAVASAVEYASRSGLAIERVGIGGYTVFPHEMSRPDLLAAYSEVFEATVAGHGGTSSSDSADRGSPLVRERLCDLLADSCEVVAYDHHHCHAAAAYHFLRTDNDPYLVITLDGEGDDKSGTVWVGRDGRLDRIAATERTASAGLLYFWVTYLLGLQPHEDEHKVMGLAGHVDPTLALELGTTLFAPLLTVDSDRLSLVLPGTVTPEHWLRHLDQVCRRIRFDHLAAAVQAFVEDIAARLTAAAVAKTQIRRVLLAGGVAMNVKLNRSVRLLECVDSLDVMPSCGDESLALGAAYLAATDLTAAPVPIRPPTLYVGSDLTSVDIDEALRLADGMGCRLIANDMDAATAASAEALLRGEPVALCAGRGEFGARALGRRSLLADPSSPAAVAALNSAIKRRDFWMPFAPAFLDGQAPNLLADYNGLPSRWMMHAFAARPDERLRGAVHSTDWTCRPQMLEDDSAEPLAAILRHVEALAGLPAVVNTSLNQHGEPIARTGVDAVGVLARSPLRYLLLGDRLLEKPV